MSKTKLNYLVDAVIGMAFILSAVSGMVFLRAGSGGYQGGRNPGFQTEMLGLSRSTWSDLHTWTSLVMIAGALIHLLLHWKWIVCMTGRLFKPARQTAPPQAGTEESCPVG